MLWLRSLIMIAQSYLAMKRCLKIVFKPKSLKFISGLCSLHDLCQTTVNLYYCKTILSQFFLSGTISILEI